MIPQVNGDKRQRAEQTLSFAEQRGMPLPTSSKPSVIGVLLIHGLNGSPGDLAELAAFLQERGMVAITMCLPGHGAHGCEMQPVDWQEWATAVRTEVHRLKERCDLVFVLGHSLGGALALYVAAQEEVTGVVAICPPLQLQPWLKPVVGLLKFMLPVLPTLYADVCDPEAFWREAGEFYHWAPTRTVESSLQFLPHVQAALPQVTAPVLILTALHDHVVPTHDAYMIYHLLGSHTKHLVIFPRSAHVLMRDYDREAVFAKTADFIARQARKAIAQRRGPPAAQFEQA